MQSNVTEASKFAFLAGETLTDGDLSLYTGRGLVVSAAALNTVLLPAAGTDIVSMILTSGGASGEQVEVEGIVPGRIYTIRAGATMLFGTYAECKLTTNNFGKWVALASGVARFQWLESVVDTQLGRAIAL